jgi:hypothetical protein
LILQAHAKIYSTLARIALDILPSQASSVPCEHVFSGSKLTATDRRARLKAETFKQLQGLKRALRNQVINFAELNSGEVEMVMDEFEDVFLADEEMKQWDGDIISQWESE